MDKLDFCNTLLMDHKWIGYPFQFKKIIQLISLTLLIHTPPMPCIYVVRNKNNLLNKVVNSNNKNTKSI